MVRQTLEDLKKQKQKVNGNKIPTTNCYFKIILLSRHWCGWADKKGHSNGEHQQLQQQWQDIFADGDIRFFFLFASFSLSESDLQYYTTGIFFVAIVCIFQLYLHLLHCRIYGEDNCFALNYLELFINMEICFCCCCLPLPLLLLIQMKLS